MRVVTNNKCLIEAASTLTAAQAGVNVTGTNLQYDGVLSVSTDNSSYTAAPLGIVVNFTGTVEVTSSAYFTGTPQRSNVAVEITVNGAQQGVAGASSYIRGVSGHNESTSYVSQMLDVVSGDLIGTQTTQLALAGAVNSVAGKGQLSIKRLK